MLNRAKEQFKFTHQAIKRHFEDIPPDQLVSTTRRFPGHMRADLQAAVEELFSAGPNRFYGVLEQGRYETLTFSSLARDGQHPSAIAPAQYHQVDIGEEGPVSCLDNGLWLRHADEMPYAVVLAFHREYGQEAGMCIELVVPIGEGGGAFVSRCFSRLESAVNASRAYRGKVLSFDDESDYRGRARGITVHRLAPVAREEVILPEGTLGLLDRNIFSFVQKRESLRSLGQSTKKGILLYGPPGNGKTHTIRYLAGNLPDHTTLIITAAQIGYLGQYMNLARLLQPSLVVIEDVDLIARAREQMGGPCEEVLLNKLLNEMDGLKESADIIFILTTNRPEDLEAALSARPGRIDQAIEVPLPDSQGRAKLIALYGKRLALSAAVIDEGVGRTEGVSAAFIKELMRRIAQSSIERSADGAVAMADLSGALDDMLFVGGKLNLKLLGGAQART
jgi:hypothetical protein